MKKDGSRERKTDRTLSLSGWWRKKNERRYKSLMRTEKVKSCNDGFNKSTG